MRYELLEQRYLLAADFAEDLAAPPASSSVAPITWFETFKEVERISLESLSNVDRPLEPGIAGPQTLAVREWIVQLTDDVASRMRQLGNAEALIDSQDADFSIISGLGTPGLMMVRGRGVTQFDIEQSLRDNSSVTSFHQNQLITGQETVPNESDFISGQLPGLDKIGVRTAWDESTGSSQTVVGVVDSGIDPTHPDLYLNIWVNQGELPAKYLVADADGHKLQDIDGDGLITFYDLNNLKRTSTGTIVVASTGVPATQAEMTTATPFATGENRHFVRDIADKDGNFNGRIDAADILADANWADGRDTDNNGFFDDFFGVNFRSGSSDPFAENNPSDELGHGTHVAGTIGAIGNNDLGVVGVNWQTSLMSLRILDNNNQGDSGAAIRAINYAREMRERLTTNSEGRVTEGANVKVLNNSWGQPGGFERSLEAAINDLYGAGILFVAAAGNGNILGQGVDNDRTPFYPASYDAPNVIAVAASDQNDNLATFSNYGKTSVDLLAPGVGIRSTIPGGGYETANGTSMASPHVAGTAALIWAALPEATVDEVREAILSPNSIDIFTQLADTARTGGRLNAAKAASAEVFAPSARLVATQDIKISGGNTSEFTIEYSHRNGIARDSIDNNDVEVTREWGTSETFPTTLKEIVKETDTAIQATYTMTLPDIGHFESSNPQLTTEIATSQFASSPNHTIPAEFPSISTSYILVENAAAISQGFTVTLDISHTWDSDLRVSLLAPNGSQVLLFDEVGGAGHNFTQTTFSDASAVSVVDATAPFSGVFRPEQSLSDLELTDPNGIWALQIEDKLSFAGGVLNHWQLDFPPSKTDTITSSIEVTNLELAPSDITIAMENADAVFDDVTATLIAPNGTRAVLFSNISMENNPGVTTTFDDSSKESILDAPPPLNRSYRPENSINELSAQQLNGTWTLEFRGNISVTDVENMKWTLTSPDSWNALDYGKYRISTIAGNVTANGRNQSVNRNDLGNFTVKVEDPNDKTYIYVDTFTDSTTQGSLRAAIIEANASAPSPRTIILDEGHYTISTPHADDPSSPFSDSLNTLNIANAGHWSNATTGDLDIESSITIIGDHFDTTIIDGLSTERIFKVGSHGALELHRIGITNGLSNVDQGGGAILSIGDLELNEVKISESKAKGRNYSNGIFGGAIAGWAGNVSIRDSWITQNVADYGGAVFLGGNTTAEILRTTFDNNDGGAIYSNSKEDIHIENTTLSSNSGGYGAINNGGSFFHSTSENDSPSLSADGRFVVFDTIDSTVVPGDTNGVQDVFVYDRLTNTYDRVSVSSFGIQGNQYSELGAISENGRWVVFHSRASNLVPGDTNNSTDVFVFDRLMRTTERVSVSDSGEQGNGFSGSADFQTNLSISKDGRYVTFTSLASNLVLDDNNGSLDVFLFDRADKTIKRVSVNDSNIEGNDNSENPMLSADGKFIAFQSKADNLVHNDSNSATDVFVYDIANSTIQRVSENMERSEGNSASGSPSISADGQYIAYSSLASNLVADDFNAASDIFFVDRISYSVERVSVTSTSKESDGFSSRPSISGDGNYIAFVSRANNLSPGVPDYVDNVFVFDRTDRSVRLIDQTKSGEQSNGASNRPAFSSDGRFVAFRSFANNLIPGDDSHSFEVLIHEQRPQEEPASDLFPVSYRPIESDVTVSFSTIVNTSDPVTNATVSGSVQISNSLFANNSTVIDIGTRSPSLSSHNILSSTSLADRIQTLQRIGASPPVHELLAGNPAYDSASPAGDGTLDQLYQVREISDAGAVESKTAHATGYVYADANANGRFDNEEIGIANLSATFTGPTSITVESAIDNPLTPFVDETGKLVAGRVEGGDYVLSTQELPGFSIYIPELQIVKSQSLQGNENSHSPMLSGNGRFITFVSAANNLVENDNNDISDIFVLDTKTTKLERVSISDDGVEGNGASSNPTISDDGRFVAFLSTATNLVPGDTNGMKDVFVYDRTARKLKRASVSSTGLQADKSSIEASISGNGEFIVFSSSADNLVNTDTTSWDIYVHDRTRETTEGFRSTNTGGIIFGLSERPSISNDGRYVTFTSDASDLPARRDWYSYSEQVYQWDRELKLVQLITIVDGNPANDDSYDTSVSADGSVIAFDSPASNLVSGDSNFNTDIFVYDRNNSDIKRVSTGTGSDISKTALSADGRFLVFTQKELETSTYAPYVVDVQTGESQRILDVGDSNERLFLTSAPSISADGRMIAFSSSSDELFSGDNNRNEDVFYIPNPLAPAGVTTTLTAGAVTANFNIGLVPNKGTIGGRLFVDVIPNGMFDTGEPALAGETVYLDLNNNKVFDGDDRLEITSADGVYKFSDVDSHRFHAIRTLPVELHEQTSPGRELESTISVFLPAGSDLTSLDFAFQRVNSTGQSSSSSVKGRVYEEKDGLPGFTTGDVPLGQKEVYLDAANFGNYDTSEARGYTKPDGTYEITGLSPRNVSVTVKLDETLVHETPLGNKFSPSSFPLFEEVQAFGKVQAIAVGDFNLDSYEDVVVAYAEGNRIGIRLNDRNGGFLPDEIDFDLGIDGTGPTSLVVGQFDSDPNSFLDLALTANTSSNVLVLLNFNHESDTRSFQSTQTIPVGKNPIDVVAGKFNSDAFLDLAVVNRGSGAVSDDETVQVLLNDRSGGFSAGAAVSTGGFEPASIVAGDFTGDGMLDVAVVHAQANPSHGTAFGDLTVLSGDNAGGLVLPPNSHYTVGGTPVDAVTADFNGDLIPDIAVANVTTNSISILLGQSDGTFRVQSNTLGTASGVYDIAFGDVDLDGDVDIIAGNLRDQNVSVFRNNGFDPNATGPFESKDVQFAPLQNYGLADVQLAERMPLVVANFDRDTDGPNHEGTLDILTARRTTKTLNLLTNQLIDGSHRVALTGSNSISNLDFVITAAILPPAFNAIADPLPIFEDAAQQVVAIDGIVKGRATGPALQFSVTSDNPSVIPSPGLLAFSGGSDATFTYKPVANANGTAVLTVRAVDAGADGEFGGADDGIFERSFTVTVLAVNDAPVFNLLGEASAKQTDGVTSVANFVTGVNSGGGADEVSQPRDAIVVVASDPTFFTGQPSIDAAGTLTFTPNPAKSGVVPVAVTLKDHGGTDNGGVDTTTKTFIVNIGAVNDAPSFTLTASPNQSVLQTAGAQTVNNFVTAFHPGGGSDETIQTVSDYIVTVDTPGIFAVLPDISNAGVLTFTPATDRTGLATVSVQVRDNGGQANGGNDLSAVQTFTIAVNGAPDTTRPTPTITTPGIQSLTNATTFDIEVDFKEPLAANTFSLADLTVTKGTTANLRDDGDGKYRIEYNSTSDGPVTFGIAESVVTDSSGNPNLPAVSVTRTIDSTGMTPELLSTVTSPFNEATFEVAIDFKEPATGFAPADLTVLNGVALDLVTVDAALGKYIATIEPIADGNVTVLLPANAVTDAAGNGNLSATPLVLTYDGTAPTPILSTDQPSTTNRTSFDVFAEFGETVTGLTKADLTITGGTASEPVLVSPGRYQFAITATGDSVELQLVAGAVSDLAGNPSPLSNQITRAIDASTFAPTLSSTSAGQINTTTFPVTVDFGKSVVDFDLDDVTVLGGTTSGLTTVNASTGKYAYTVTASGDGQVSVLIASGTVQDAGGNNNSASATLVRTVDRVAPAPQFTASVGALTNQSVFTLDVDFREAVNGFDIPDVVASGATLSGLEYLGAGRYRMTATATQGPVSFSLPAGAATDDAGNPSLAATPLARTVDTTGMTPLLSSTTPNLSNAASIVVAIDFGEPVAGFTLSDLTVLGGSASNLTTVNAATGKYSATITPAADGNVTVLLPANSAADSAGNGNLPAVPLVRTIDRSAPTVVLSTNQPSPTNQTTFEVVATFSEPIAGLTKSDLVVTGGTTSEPTPIGTNRYAFTINATGSSVQIQLAQGTVQDAAGNTSLASNSLNLSIDSTALVPVISSTSSQILSNATFPVSVNFGKAVAGFDLSDVTVLGGNASALTAVDAASGRYTFDVTAAADGSVSVLIAAGVVPDEAGNRNVASDTLVRTVDRIASTPQLTTNVSALTGESAFTLTADFGESVSGFELTDVIASNATLSDLQSVGAGIYRMTATAGEGPVSFNLPAASVTDGAGNANLAAAPLSLTVDTLGMTPVLSSSVASPSNVASFVVAIDFTEAATGLALADITVLNGTASNLTPIDAATGKYNVTITPAADGNVTVLLPANAATDAAGNGNLAGVPLVRAIDRTAPTAVLSTDQPSTTNRTSFDVFAEFGEAVTGLTKSDLTVTGGTASDPVLVSPGRYRFAITATGDSVELRLGAGAVTDLAGNPSPLSNSLTLAIDAATFVPTLTSASASVINVASFPVAVDFGKPVASFGLEDVTVIGGTASALTTVNAAAGRYAFTVTASGDGQVSILIADGTVQDNGGNSNAASSTLNRQVDRVAPTPQLTTSVGVLTNQSAFTLNVDFGEAVTGFTLSDMIASGATLSDLEDLGSGRYRMTATATQGSVAFSLPAGVASDAAGNSNAAATPLTLTVDTSGITPTLSSATPSLSNVESFVMAIDFGEPVVGFTMSDLTVLGGSASNLTTVDAATGKYSATITPSSDGNVTLLLPANSATDAANNGNLVAAPLVRTIDRKAPSVVLSTNQPSPTNQTTFEVVATFSEPIVELTKSDLVITGGTASDPILIDNNRYAFTINATGSSVQMQLAASAVQDEAGNASLASNSLKLNIDSTALVPALSSTRPMILNSTTFPVDVSFGKPVVGFDLTDITVLGGIASALTTIDAASGRFALTVTASSDGPVSVLIAAGAVPDAAGNRNVASETLVRTVDRTAPTPRLSTSVPTLTREAAFTLTVDFGEDVSGFALADVIASNATLSDLQSVGGGLFRMTATAGEGPVSFNLPAAMVTDGAGNTNLAATPLALSVDTTGMTPTLSSTAASVSNAASFDVTIDFSEPATGFSLADLTVLNGTASNLVPVNAATGKYNVTITPTADGNVTVLLPANAATDAAGNGNLAGVPLVRTIDRTAPTAVLSTDQPSTTNRTSFDVFAEFGETVTGLTKTDLSVTGGTASDPVLVSPGRYRFAITATGGSVELQLVAGAVSDLAGNPSPLSNSLTLAIDASTFVPTLTSTSASVINADSFPVAVDFGKSVVNFGMDDVTVLGGTVSNLTTVNASTGKYAFTVTAAADGQVSVLIASGTVQDGVGNLNSGSSALNRQVDRIAPAPRLTASADELTNQAVFTLDVDFGEVVTGFTISDVAASGATLSGLENLGSGRYRMTATAAQGSVAFSLPAGVASDGAGNNNAAATPLTLTVDTLGMTPTLSSTTPSLSNVESFVMAIDFGEPVVDFTLPDLTVLGGSASNLTTVDAATGKYSATITPAADGNVTIQMPAGAVLDAAGNPNLASVELLRSIDSSSPQATLALAPTTVRGTFDVAIQFNESVTGLSDSDFVVVNGQLQNLVGDGTSFTAELIADGVGEVAVELPAGRATDAAGNLNAASDRATANFRPNSIVLTGSDEVVDLQTLDTTLLSVVETIDIRGTGNNSLRLSASQIATWTPGQQLRVIADPGDQVDFDDGWTFSKAEVIDGQLARVFTNDAATVTLIGPHDWTNPINNTDVNGSGEVTALDALRIINAINRGTIYDKTNKLVDAATIDPSVFAFFDVNHDYHLTALDALLVINELNRNPTKVQSELAGESSVQEGVVAVPTARIADDLNERNRCIAIEHTEALASGDNPSRSKALGEQPSNTQPRANTDVEAKLASDEESPDDVDSIDEALAMVQEW
ncbi:Ig-like domain-containing protein [Rosistilla oblonga]|uniref:Ig-like domain-containing protein n=1 Tax=Rosistilla oblonga TaxID=2527990 RepID=UPI003A96F448